MVNKIGKNKTGYSQESRRNKFLLFCPYAKRLYHKGTMSEGVSLSEGVLKDTASHIPFRVRNPLGHFPNIVELHNLFLFPFFYLLFHQLLL